MLVLPRIDGFTREQLSIAANLQPLHSQLCAIAVQVLWKSDQLIRALFTALNAGDLIVAATMVRSLVESTAAFGSHPVAVKADVPMEIEDMACEYNVVGLTG